MVDDAARNQFQVVLTDVGGYRGDCNDLANVFASRVRNSKLNTISQSSLHFCQNYAIKLIRQKGTVVLCITKHAAVKNYGTADLLPPESLRGNYESYFRNAFCVKFETETTRRTAVEFGTHENEGSLCLLTFYSDLFLNIFNVKSHFTFQNTEYLITSILFMLKISHNLHN
jgi:hypothetical protein